MALALFLNNTNDSSSIIVRHSAFSCGDCFLHGFSAQTH